MKIISQTIDILFPPRATELLIRNMTGSLATDNDYSGKAIYLSDYKNELVHACVVENKYFNNSRAQKLLAELLDKWLQRHEQQIYLIPIPLGSKRKQQRGHNQVTSVLRKINSPEVTIIKNALFRRKNTVPQTSLGRKERLNNLKDVFMIKDTNSLQKLNNSIVIIVDDVITTGATLDEARATLAPHIPTTTKLITLAFAH